MGGITLMADYRRIARIIRAKGLSGEVMVLFAPGFSLRAAQGLRLWIVPPDHDLIRETSVRSVTERGEYALLALNGVTKRSVAQRLQGRSLLACAQDVKDMLITDDNSAVGLAVFDVERGALGTIVEERVGEEQTLWVLDGPFGEVLIPAVDELIRARDKEKVEVLLPHGLLELNT
ncbi:MAG: hypothetical protein LBL27_04615 [Coriobacteriales bacterium]|jgi:16S rRNA processing protein RimM|nr:hypothetical protein [Coriobacteriales bacterium]